MTRRAGSLRAVAVAAAVAAIGGALVSAAPPAPAARGPAGESHPSIWLTRRTFDGALARAEAAGPSVPAPGVRAAIVPHHWLAGHLIAGGLRDLAATRAWRRVVLIGPNHSGAGGAPVTTSALPWATPWGTVRPDADAVGELVRERLARTDAEVLTYEHSIAGIVPAIGALMPGATVIPIAIDGGLAPARLAPLAARVERWLRDPGTVLVASVDFSHYLSAAEARRMNAETVPALRSLDRARILGWGNEHLDSPESIWVVMEAMRRLGATEFELRADVESSALDGRTLPPVTSYVYGLYRRGG